MESDLIKKAKEFIDKIIILITYFEILYDYFIYFYMNSLKCFNNKYFQSKIHYLQNN